MKPTLRSLLASLSLAFVPSLAYAQEPAHLCDGYQNLLATLGRGEESEAKVRDQWRAMTDSVRYQAVQSANSASHALSLERDAELSVTADERGNVVLTHSQGQATTGHTVLYALTGKGLHLDVQGGGKITVDEGLNQAGLSRFYLFLGEGEHQVEMRATVPCLVVDGGGNAVRGPLSFQGDKASTAAKPGGISTMAVINGTAGNDTIYGTTGADTIYGYDGADNISGGDGNDLVYGNIGRDVIYGNNGDDDLRGNENGDGVDGGPGGDYVYGNQGNDCLGAGTPGAYSGDFLYGGQDDDGMFGATTCTNSPTFCDNSAVCSGDLGYDYCILGCPIQPGFNCESRNASSCYPGP